jgi:ParB family chromosome partitioning protein
MNVTYIPINKILPSPYHLRKREGVSGLETLMKSISNLGVIQPLIIRNMGGFFELVSGMRRFEASKALGLCKVPCVIVKTNELESIEISLAENIQRKDLSFLEQADAFQMMMTYFGVNKECISDKIGEKEDFVSERLKTLSLDKGIKNIISENNITLNQATKLLTLNKENREDALKKIINSSSAGLYENVILQKSLEETFSAMDNAPFEKDIRIFSNILKEAVNKIKGFGFKTSCVIMKSSQTLNINIKISV